MNTRLTIALDAMGGDNAPGQIVAGGEQAARELGVAQRTVERYRTDIARKLNVNSIAEIAQIVQLAGLETDDAQLPRLHRWRKPAE